MKRSVSPTMLSNGKLLQIVNARTMMSAVIRGHAAIDAALAVAISELLPQPHALEVKRLDASLKIDLATALEILPKEVRPAYQKLNAIRNRFAHEPNTRVSAQQAVDFRNTFAGTLVSMMTVNKAEKHSPGDIVRRGIAVLYIFAATELTHIRDQRVANNELLTIVHEVLDRKQRPDEYAGMPNDERIAAVVKKERETRRLTGDA